jgi:hypothetical protein
MVVYAALWLRYAFTDRPLSTARWTGGETCSIQKWVDLRGDLIGRK